MQEENIKLNWLQHPHKATAVLTHESKINPAEMTSAFIFAFKDEDILLAQVYGRGWDIPGGHRERSETPEETISRELFEECATHTDLMGPLGYIELNLTSEKPPANYPYPFPTSYLMFYWGIVSDIGKPSASMEVGEPKLFKYEEALKLDCIKNHKLFFMEAYSRAKIVAKKLNENN